LFGGWGASPEVNRDEMQGFEGTLMTGSVEIQRDTGNKRHIYNPVDWESRFFLLSDHYISIYEDASCMHLLAEMQLTPETVTLETSLFAYSFQVVSPYSTLYAAADSAETRSAWINEFKTQSRTSPHVHMPEVILGAAKMQAEVGHIYTANFKRRQDMKLVFSQAVGGEWALVQESTEESGVSVGSMLVAVNGESLELVEHSKVIDKIRYAQLPAELTFRRAPRFEGALRKKAQGLQGKVKNWKTRYCVLEHGVLSYYNDERRRHTNDARARVRKQQQQSTAEAGSLAVPKEQGAEGRAGKHQLSFRWRGKQQRKQRKEQDGRSSKGKSRSSSEKGFFPLSGAALRVVPRGECGRSHCFQLTGGAGRLLLQASSISDFYQWCAVLYHALSVANGCGFILEAAHERANRAHTAHSKQGFLQQLKTQAEATSEFDVVVDSDVVVEEA
jgi:hypothetical protein